MPANSATTKPLNSWFCACWFEKFCSQITPGGRCFMIGSWLISRGVAELGAVGEIGVDDDVVAPIVAGDLGRTRLEVDVGDGVQRGQPAVRGRHAQILEHR